MEPISQSVVWTLNVLSTAPVPCHPLFRDFTSTISPPNLTQNFYASLFTAKQNTLNPTSTRQKK
jgi:hypothetical protein